MEVLYAHCAGLDVHKESVVACARHVAGGKISTELKAFATTTGDLMRLADWLREQNVTHIAMEATGVYWKPVWHILAEGPFTLVLANAAHVRNVPGRKTDNNDAMWLADLMAHGLIRASFVPEEPTQRMRDLMRTRKQLVREQVTHTHRIQKTLEDANVKLDSVVTDILGLSGRRMIEAMIAGAAEPRELAALAHCNLRATPAQLEAALRGRVQAHHRLLLRLHLDQIDALGKAIAAIDQEVSANEEPLRRAVELLSTIPGLSRLSSQTVIAEIGTDMSRFATAGHLVSWAGLCPRNDESAGKRRSTRMRKTGCWLKPALIQSAWAAARTRNSYLQAQYHRLRTRRGPKKAIGAVAASILTAAYYMLKNDRPYKDLGPDYFDRDHHRQAARLTKRLQTLGFDVLLTPASA